MNCDLKIIKKKYGENMMKLVRKLFSTLLKEESDKRIKKLRYMID